jgi:hypothetical protein
LPQFYPTPENDNWWGKGFTEWTSVVRMRPLFPGHYQPRVPSDLGYYDLRSHLVRERQAELAQAAGIEGFCYWHYWFGNGRRLLDRVFSEVVESGKPDFPFCLCWANHSWYNKVWVSHQPDRLLMEQTYPGEQDYMAHFQTMLPAFRDSRYIRVNGRLLFGIYNPEELDMAAFSHVWNRLAEENGLKGFYFFAFSSGMDRYQRIRHSLYDASVLDVLFSAFHTKTTHEFVRLSQPTTSLVPERVAYYADYCREAKRLFCDNPLAWPCVLPGFDHSPRSGHHGHILVDSTPELWGELLREVSSLLSDRPYEENVLFIKAWNEWGEGNYLEPDAKYGHRFLDELRDALSKCET